MSGSNEEFDFTTKAPQQIQSGTIFGKSKTAPVSPENPQVRYIATRGTGGGRTVGFFELNDGVNPPSRITDEVARGFIQTNKLGSINTDTNVLPILPPNQEVVKGVTDAQGVVTPAGFKLSDQERKNLGPVKAVNTNLEQKVETTKSDFSLGERTKGAFNIERFKAEVSSADSILPTHSFLVVFAPMPWAIQRYPQAGNLDSILTMRCDNVILPSINLLQEQNIRRYGFGPVENVAYGINVGDFTLQFIVDKKAHVVGFFEAWLNRIVNRYSYGGADMNTATDGRTPYEIAYKDTYACSSVNVFMYDRSQNNVLEYNIYDVFPTGIQSMNMSWSEENTLMKLNVTFSFTDLRIQQSAEKDKSGVGFGSSVDMTNALLTGPKMTDAQMRALSQGGILVSDGKGGIGFDATPGTVKVSGEYGFESGSVTSIQSSAAAPQTTSDSPVPKNYSALGVRINPGA